MMPPQGLSRFIQQAKDVPRVRSVPAEHPRVLSDRCGGFVDSSRGARAERRDSSQLETDLEWSDRVERLLGH